MNRIVKNFVVNGLSSIISQVITFATMTYYARLIGKEFFGSITLAQQVTMYFSIAVLFGLQTLGVRMISNNTKDPKTAVEEIISFRLIGALVCFTLVSILCIYGKHSFSFNLVLFLFSFTLFPMAMNLDWLFNGFQVMQYNAVYNLCKSIIPGILIVIFLRGNNNVYIIPVATFFGLLIGTVYQYCILIFKYKLVFKISINSNKFFSLVKLSFPFFISGLLAMVNNNIDKIIIGFTRSEGELGIYQSAYAFISFLISVEAMIFTPVFPALINLYNEGKEDKLKALSQMLSKYISIMIFPLVLGGLILSKEIITLFFGKEYISAYIPFNILLVYILILYFREVYAYQLNAWNEEIRYLKIVSISAVLNALLCLVFVPNYGYIAAAVITTVSELVNFVMMRAYSNKIIKIRVLHKLDIIIPTILMGSFTLILKFMGINLILNLIISIIIYAISVFWFKIVNIKEIKGFITKR